MENTILSGKAVSSLTNTGHGRQERSGRKLFLWRKGLLPWRLAHLAIVPSGLPNDKTTGSRRWAGLIIRLLLGGIATCQTACNSRVDALSSKGTDEKTQSNFSHSSKIPEGGQLSSCADREPNPALRATFATTTISALRKLTRRHDSYGHRYTHGDGPFLPGVHVAGCDLKIH